MTVLDYRPLQPGPSGFLAAPINHTVDAIEAVYYTSWLFLSRLAFPIRYLMEKLNYIRWIKKALLLLLAIQFFTFLFGTIYYGAVVAATVDEQNTIMTVIFTVISLLTGGVFVIATSIITPPEWVSLIHDGRRTFLQKKMSLNFNLTTILTTMTILMVIQSSMVGFSPEFGFANDDDQDVIEGISDQQLETGVTIDGEFDPDSDLGKLPLDFDGNVVSEEQFDDLWTDRVVSTYMFILCGAGIHILLTRSQVYLVSRRMQKIKRIVGVVEYDESGFSRDRLIETYDSIPSNTPGDIELLTWMVAGASICFVYGLVVSIAPGDLYVMLCVFASMGGLAASGLFASYLFTKSR